MVRSDRWHTVAAREKGKQGQTLPNKYLNILPEL